MTAYTEDAAKAALAGILDSPTAVPLEDPMSVGTIISLANLIGQARQERDDARRRLQAVRQTCWPLHANPGPLGDFARTVLAETDPRTDHAA